MTREKEVDRAKGVLLGLACGDALGRPVEFMSSEQINDRYGRLTDMMGYGTHNQPPGAVSDDTDMAVCIARSILERDGFDGEDIARKFVEWYQDGPFDIGGMTKRSLDRIQRDESWMEAGVNDWRRAPEGMNARNGSVVRSPPVALAYTSNEDKLVESSIKSS